MTKLLLSSSTESRRVVAAPSMVLRSVVALEAEFLARFRADPVSTWSARFWFDGCWSIATEDDIEEDADDDVDDAERVVWWNGLLVLVVVVGVDKEVGYRSEGVSAISI